MSSKTEQHAPASHENGLVCAKLLSVDQDGDVGENISAAQPVQVEQDITGMPCELYAAVCCTSHFVEFCKIQKNKDYCTQKKTSPCHNAPARINAEVQVKLSFIQQWGRLTKIPPFLHKAAPYIKQTPSRHLNFNPLE